MTKNDYYGWHLVAIRNIKQGDVVLKERPTILGSETSNPAVCLGCHLTLNLKDETRHKCAKCGWTLCSIMCEYSPFHKDECRIMEARDTKHRINHNPLCYARNFDDVLTADYIGLKVLRVLLLKDKDTNL